MSNEMGWVSPPMMSEENTIEYHTEEIEFELPDAEKVSNWILSVVSNESKILSAVNFIFCNDPYLHSINVEYLDHDTLTDIVTFQYSKHPYIEGDLFISMDRIKENANTFQVPLLKELHRVMIHGILHICGYGDKSTEEKKLMREKENAALAILEKM